MAKKKGKAPNTASISSNSDIDEMTSALAQTNLGDESPPRLNHTRLTRKIIVREFERYFGDTSKLDNWQRLCGDVGLDDDLPSISKCRVVSQTLFALQNLPRLICWPYRHSKKYGSTFTILLMQCETTLVLRSDFEASRLLQTTQLERRRFSRGRRRRMVDRSEHCWPISSEERGKGNDKGSRRVT